MIPPFGAYWHERVACGLMMITGSLGLFAPATVSAFASSILGQPWPGWFVANPGRAWLVCQSLLVIAGVLGMPTRCFTLAIIGIAAALVVVTPIGLLTFVPGIVTLLLVVLRRRTFWEFTPRWRGEGPRPPGHWR